MLDFLHWLPFQHRIIFRIAALAWRCLLGHWALLRPAYEIFAIPPWAPEVAVPSDQWNEGVLSVPFARRPTSTLQARACILSGRPLCLEWASIGTTIAPQGSL